MALVSCINERLKKGENKGVKFVWWYERGKQDTLGGHDGFSKQFRYSPVDYSIETRGILFLLHIYIYEMLKQAKLVPMFIQAK